MFHLNLDDRLSYWLDHRRKLERIDNPLESTCEFWNSAPFIPINRNVDPHYQASWPTPWEIIEQNQYDDFTRALMIGWTLKLTKKFKDSKVEIKTFVDNTRSREYNIVVVDDIWALNYVDTGPVDISNIPDSFRLENLVELTTPR